LQPIDEILDRLLGILQIKIQSIFIIILRLIIQKTGISTTIQDEGRPLARAFGVPHGGALDWFSYRLCNTVLRNTSGAAVLEIVPGAGWLAQAETEGCIACCGPGASLYIHKTPKLLNRPHVVREGEQIEIRSSGPGVYVYLGVSGGWDVPLVLGSRSTCLAGNFGGLEGRMVQAGDQLDSGEQEDLPVSKHFKALHPVFTPDYFHWTKQGRHTIRVIPGPEWQEWTVRARSRFVTHTYIVSEQRDRMGIRLKGNALYAAETKPMISTGVLPGTLQVPPDGQPIVLLNDAQTTGGYPRIGQLCWADLPKIVQCLSGQSVHFQWIELAEAEMLMYRWRTFFDRLRFNINLCDPF
jgi:biotin-dependent carboxylase-like uncharacterized protein